MRQLLVLALCCCGLAAGGCGGYYILTVPDQVAPAGDDAVTVIRLERNDFFVMSFGVEGAPMRFQADGLIERGAYTDRLGYAGTTVPVPAEPGRYTMKISLMDAEGEELHRQVPLFVWPKSAPVLAVDYAALPMGRAARDSGAAAALQTLAETHRMLYLSRRSVPNHPRLHKELIESGYPDGPILLWQREYWRIVKGWWRLPKIVIESRLVGQLPNLREMFPNLSVGLAGGALAENAFRQAGLKVVWIGRGGGDDAKTVHRADWADLGRRGTNATPTTAPAKPSP